MGIGVRAMPSLNFQVWAQSLSLLYRHSRSEFRDFAQLQKVFTFEAVICTVCVFTLKRP